jgi:glycosyltransferase involved in cell wall biosynthesis
MSQGDASAMRIIVMTNRFGDLGTHPQLTRVALHLKASGHDVRAITLAPPGSIAQMFSEAGIATDVIDMPWRGSLIPLVAKLSIRFRRWHPDVVIAFLYEAIIPARLAASLGGVPVVISSIRNEYFGRRYRELLLRATARLSAVTVVNSRRVAESLVRRGVASRRHLALIHNGVDTTLFHPAPEIREDVRLSLGVSDAEFVWLTIGRLTEQKDYPCLLQAFSRVVASTPRTRLLVLGRGPLQSQLPDLARRMGLTNDVSFLGFRADVPSLLAAADAFVLASRYEGLPNVVMEALAAGVPVVGTAVGGMDELVHEGVSGYLVPPSLPEALASAMRRMMDVSNEDRHEMGMKGRDLMQSHFERGRIMETWHELISDTMGSVRRRQTDG